MKLLTTVAAAALLLGGAALALHADAPAAAPAPAGAPAGTKAAPTAKKHHPRRHQVNKRIKKQEARIDKKEKEGKITPAQADQLRANDKKVAQEEKDMAAQDNGHITKTDQKALNQELNQNSKDISKE